jgi:pimeloyl-ACP methyl ester carboxylesterase
MPYVTTDDGVKLHYEETGSGFPIVFVHEFAGDHRSYEPQMRYFGRRYRCIAYDARGYPPSDVPDDERSYSQERARDDIRSMLDGLAIERAHIVGISMGGFATLHFGLAYPERTRSLVIGGCGYGAAPGKREQFQQEAEAAAVRFETLEMRAAAEAYALGATRVQFQNKDPRGWEEFGRMLAEHSARGSALTLRGVQKRRPSLFDLVSQMRGITVPVLVMTGDEDDPCIEASILMKRSIPSAALVVLPNSGHAINLEEPALFNQFVGDFLHQVESGRWRSRDPRSITGKIL